jgi:hypothetical protein
MGPAHTDSSIRPRIEQVNIIYCAQKKGYFVDGHEKATTIAYLVNFIPRYFDFERRPFEWVQLTQSQALDLEKNKQTVKNAGFSYTDEYGNQMVEYHVDGMVLVKNEERWLADDSIVNRSAANVNLNNFGGNLSIRFPTGEKPLIIIGYDKSIFKQYSLSKKKLSVTRWPAQPISEE